MRQAGLLLRIAIVGVIAVAAATAIQASPTSDYFPGGSTAAPLATPAATATAPATRSPVPTPAAFALTMSDDDLTQAAAGGFPQTVNGVTVTDPRVRVETDRVRLTASAKVFFGSTQFVMTAVPTVTDGRIDVTVDSATIAGLSLPSETRASIADTVRATITKLVPASVRVTSVSFAPGALTVRGIQP